MKKILFLCMTLISSNIKTYPLTIIENNTNKEIIIICQTTHLGNESVLLFPGNEIGIEGIINNIKMMVNGDNSSLFTVPKITMPHKLVLNNKPDNNTVFITYLFIH